VIGTTATYLSIDCQSVAQKSRLCARGVEKDIIAVPLVFTWLFATSDELPAIDLKSYAISTASGSGTGPDSV
jgi:hypothetical protein